MMLSRMAPRSPSAASGQICRSPMTRCGTAYHWWLQKLINMLIVNESFPVLPACTQLWILQSSAPQPAVLAPAGLLLLADGAGQCDHRHEGVPRGDIWAGHPAVPLPARQRGRAAGQRHRVRPGRLLLDAGAGHFTQGVARIRVWWHDTVQLANDTEYGLAAYFWTQAREALHTRSYRG